MTLHAACWEAERGPWPGPPSSDRRAGSGLCVPCLASPLLSGGQDRAGTTGRGRAGWPGRCGSPPAWRPGPTGGRGGHPSSCSWQGAGLWLPGRSQQPRGGPQHRAFLGLHISPNRSAGSGLSKNHRAAAKEHGLPSPGSPASFRLGQHSLDTGHGNPLPRGSPAGPDEEADSSSPQRGRGRASGRGQSTPASRAHAQHRREETRAARPAGPFVCPLEPARGQPEPGPDRAGLPEASIPVALAEGLGGDLGAFPPGPPRHRKQSLRV